MAAHDRYTTNRNAKGIIAAAAAADAVVVVGGVVVVGIGIGIGGTGYSSRTSRARCRAFAAATAGNSATDIDGGVPSGYDWRRFTDCHDTRWRA